MRTEDVLFDDDTHNPVETAAERRRRIAGAQRRRFRGLLVAGILAIWATVATVAAWHFYHEPQAAPDSRAAAALARSTETLDLVLMRIAGDIAALPQTPSALAATLAALERDYTALGEAAGPVDPERQRRVADLFIAFSAAHLAVDQPGRAASAAQAARVALESLDDAQPVDRGRLADAFLAEGDALASLGDFEGAAAAFAEAAAINGALSAAAPDDPALLRALSTAFEREGQAQSRLRRWDAAAGRFHQALAIRSQLAAIGAEAEPQLLEALVVAHSNLGDHTMEAGSPDLAVDHYEDAIVVLERLAALEPDNLARQEALALHQARLGRAHVAAGAPSAGLEMLEAAADTLHAAVAREPTQRRWQVRLAEVLGWAGAVNLQRLDYPGARAAYTRALEIHRRLAERDSADQELASAFANTLLRLAEIDRAEGLDEMALLRAGEAISLHRQVLAGAPQDVAAATALAEALATGAELGLAPRVHLEEALDVLARFAEDDELHGGHAPLAEEIRQRLASLAP